MPRNEALERIHTACNQLCPTGKEQRGLSKLRNEMDRDVDLSDKDKIIRLLGAVMDGLKFGNWPEA